MEGRNHCREAKRQRTEGPAERRVEESEEEDAAYDTEPYEASEEGWATPPLAGGDKHQIDTIYCDLDGVLADFDKGFRKMTGGQAPEEYKLRDMWERIEACEWKEGFFGGLEWMEGGEELWEALAASGVRLSVLSGVPKGKEGWSTEQKIDWCERRLEGRVRDRGDLEVICCHSEHKQRWAHPRAVLIDDRAMTNGEEWKAAGGVFVHHTSLEDTLRQLSELGIV
uniref:Uncharacterized protein n=1 Tax=Hemiselmis andersenii TaxID=464988 RepID=A0A6U4MIU9_HEMAN|mmetsp:Transcript_16817/g.38857  ORF Transcript_16817/g.38857 Transcript_16817/m.38857 type:complete len:225 (+) Transcript_16817:838-1512(+)